MRSVETQPLTGRFVLERRTIFLLLRRRKAAWRQAYSEASLARGRGVVFFLLFFSGNTLAILAFGLEKRQVPCR
jgi:hypothetical protein